MTSGSPPVQPKKKLLHIMQSNLRLQHYSRRTEATYLDWVRRFVRFHRLRHPAEMGAAEIRAFLAYLAVDRRLSASSLAQATAAVVFLYRNVLQQDPGDFGPLPRPRTPIRIPVVLTPEEVRAVIGQLEGAPRLVGLLLYGAGLRLTEALTLRVKDVDLTAGGDQGTAREGGEGSGDLSAGVAQGRIGGAGRAGPGAAYRGPGEEPECRLGGVAARPRAQVPGRRAESGVAVALPGNPALPGPGNGADPTASLS